MRVITACLLLTTCSVMFECKAGAKPLKVFILDDPPTGFRGHFQQAMAAPAANPELKGTVAAVQLGKYWDHELAALVEKSSKLKEKMNDFKYKDGLTGDALKKACADYRATQITPREEEILSKGVSDGGFHYLGSARIMCGISKGFAEAMIGLEEASGDRE